MKDTDVLVIYDGDCPLCQQFSRVLRLRESVGKVSLVDARNDQSVVEEMVKRGFDLDQGMVVVVGGQYYHGAAAMHVLAMMSSTSGWFNRVNRLVFGSARVARVLYPILRTGRNLLLRLLGRTPFSAL